MKIRIGEEPQEISSNICHILPLLIPLIAAGVGAVGSVVSSAMAGGEQKKPQPGGSGLQGSAPQGPPPPANVVAKSTDVAPPPPPAAPPPIMGGSGSGLGGSIAPPSLPQMGGQPRKEERFV